MSKIDSPKLVVALYSFKGKNNDELCFKKDDIITITQLDDGGWWEGTLLDKTGWFPSNYVKDYKPTEAGSLTPKLSPDKIVPEIAVNQKLNRDIVLKDIVDSERAHVVEMQSLMNNFLQTVETSSILKKDEYKQLTGNLPDILDAHQRLLTSLDNAILQGPEAKVGNLFLNMAPRLKLIHTTYCSGHPQAVCILDRYRDELNEFMERNGVVPPGILVLTTGLSKPFRRLEKYSTMLQELERHTEKNHPDRGDTQRCVSVYREISDQCAAIRKQRELALHILTSGVKGWEGEELSSLGDVIYVGPVTLIAGGERSDRYFVLFSSTLLMLSTSPRMSSFVYEGKLPLTGIRVVATKVDDTKNSFEISGPMIDNISVLCSTKEERRHWIELLNQDPGGNLIRSPTILSHTTTSSGKSQLSPVEHSPPQGTKTPWSLASLRPAPPTYILNKNFGKSDSTDPCRSPKSGNFFLDERQFEEDALILKVIEGYCKTASARLTVNSAMLDYDPPHKSCDRVSLNSRVAKLDMCEDRSLAETVKILKGQMTDLQSQILQLTQQLDEERRSRISLAATVKRSIAIADGAAS